MTMHGGATIGGKRANELMNRALQLTDAGWCAFGVLDGPERKPLARGYGGGLPFSETKVRSMRWIAASQVGISLPAHLIGLDVDVKDDRRGAKQLQALTDLYAPLPETLHQTTRSGGQHLVFDISALPPGSRFRGNARPPLGGRPGIDIVTSKHRYLVVYDDDAFLAPDRVVAPLPESWWPSVLSDDPSMGAALSAPSAGLRWAADSYAAVASALPGSRNETLNAHAFQLAVRGRLSDDSRQLLTDAALGAGLSPTEIAATLRSAAEAGRRITRRADNWLADVMQDPAIQARRSSVDIVAAARHLADVSAAATGDRPVGMATRTLAEVLGVTADTANRHLGFLVQRGWLNREVPLTRTEAHAYSLTRPAGSGPKSDNHPSPPPTASAQLYTPSTASFGVEDDSEAAGTSPEARRVIDLLVGDVLGHPVFRVGPGPRLTRSAARVLVALSFGPAIAPELRERAGLGKTSIRRATVDLVAEGLARHDPSTGVIELASTDVVASLDAWAEEHGVTDRADIQRARHEAERERFAEGEKRRNFLDPRLRALGRPRSTSRASATSPGAVQQPTRAT